MIRLIGTAVVTAALALGASPALAATVTLGYTNITNNSNLALANQLSTEVTGDDASNQVFFKFLNNVGIASSITDIYFSDTLGLFGKPLLQSQITDSDTGGSDGVSFSPGASPGDLPGGNNATPDFVRTAGLTTDSNSPMTPQHGVNSSSEWLTIALNLVGGSTWSHVLASLGDGSLRLGLHMTALADGKSDSYINNPPSAVPLPAGVWLFGTALAGMGALGMKRRRRA